LLFRTHISRGSCREFVSGALVLRLTDLLGNLCESEKRGARRNDRAEILSQVADDDLKSFRTRSLRSSSLNRRPEASLTDGLTFYNIGREMAAPPSRSFAKTQTKLHWVRNFLVIAVALLWFAVLPASLFADMYATCPCCGVAAYWPSGSFAYHKSMCCPVFTGPSQEEIRRRQEEELKR